MIRFPIIMQCVAESPSHLGDRRALSDVPAGYAGPCSLHYELYGRRHLDCFATYQQALTAAEMAVFCDKHPYQKVVIRPGAQANAALYPDATRWRQAQSRVSNSASI